MFDMVFSALFIATSSAAIDPSNNCAFRLVVTCGNQEHEDIPSIRLIIFRRILGFDRFYGPETTATWAALLPVSEKAKDAKNSEK